MNCSIFRKKKKDKDKHLSKVSCVRSQTPGFHNPWMPRFYQTLHFNTCGSRLSNNSTRKSEILRIEKSETSSEPYLIMLTARSRRRDGHDLLWGSHEGSWFSSQYPCSSGGSWSRTKTHQEHAYRRKPWQICLPDTAWVGTCVSRSSGLQLNHALNCPFKSNSSIGRYHTRPKTRRRRRSSLLFRWSGWDATRHSNQSISWVRESWRRNVRNKARNN